MEWLHTALVMDILVTQEYISFEYGCFGNRIRIIFIAILPDLNLVSTTIISLYRSYSVKCEPGWDATRFSNSYTWLGSFFIAEVFLLKNFTRENLLISEQRRAHQSGIVKNKNYGAVFGKTLISGGTWMIKTSEIKDFWQ